MTYSANETSVQSGRPVECYRFVAGGDQFFYTSSEGAVTIGLQVYEPKTISRSARAEGPNKIQADFDVTLPTSDPVAQLFIGSLPGVRVRLTVFRFHRDDLPTPQVITYFDGYVQTVAPDESRRMSVLTARSILAGNGAIIPVRSYRGQCGSVLYGNRCNADSTDPSIRAASRAVLGQSGLELTVDDLGGYPAGWFTGGYVEALGAADYRLILQDAGGGALTLLAPFGTVPATVNVLAGCDHTLGANGCLKHDNVENYRGFAFVPNRDLWKYGAQ